MDNQDRFLESPLPSAPETERATLGHIILDNTLMAQASISLKSDWFYTPSYRNVFYVMLTLWAEGKPIDPITIGEVMRAAGTLDQAGGMSEIANYTYGLPGIVKLDYYIKILKEKAALRWCVKAGNQLMTDALTSDEPIEDLLVRHNARLNEFQIRSGFGRNMLVPVKDMIVPQLERYERFFNNVSDAIPSGFAWLDGSLWGRGFARRMLHVIAGRPGAGKTAFALDVIASACKAGMRVYFASLELAKEVILDRMWSAPASISRTMIQPGMSSVTLKALAEKAYYFDAWDLTIDNDSRSVDEIGSVVKALNMVKPVDLIVVDYMQKMTAAGRTRYEMMTNVSLGLAALSLRDNAALIGLSQMSRGDKTGREPELSDLRESGAFEQDARTVSFLYGDRDADDENADLREIYFKCAKQGEGALFRRVITFRQKLMTFRNDNEIWG